jgi:hypothetical protein
MTAYSYSLYRTADTHAGTGVVTVVNGSAALVGSGTAFTTELAVGSIITVGANVMAIRSITDNDDAVLQTALVTGFAVQSYTYNNLINVESLTPRVYAPRSPYKPWINKIDLVNGLARAMGRPSCSWMWGYITQGQYGALRAVLSSASARTYIRTRTTENTDRYDVFEAAYLWPDEQDRQATRRVGFTLDFRDLIML